MDIYRIQTADIDLDEVIQAIRDPASGGEAIFLGTVRDQFLGRDSRGLFYEAYQELAEKELARIGETLKREFGVRHVVMIHRIGELALTETAVVVAVSAPHRHEALAACEAGINRVKSRAPIWKQERWADGGEDWHHDPEASSGEKPL